METVMDLNDFSFFPLMFTGIFPSLGLLSYVWVSLCIYMIARKTATDDAWLGWIPIVNIYLLCKIARRPGWWLFLFFIPLVNFVIAIIIFTDIARECNQPSWLGILIIFPVLNLVLLGILAFA